MIILRQCKLLSGSRFRWYGVQHEAVNSHKCLWGLKVNSDKKSNKTLEVNIAPRTDFQS